MKTMNNFIVYLMLAVVLVFTGATFAMTFANMRAEAGVNIPVPYSPYAIMLCIFVVVVAGVVMVFALEQKDKEYDK